MYVSVLPAPDRAATWHDASRTKRRWEVLLVKVLQIRVVWFGQWSSKVVTRLIGHASSMTPLKRFLQMYRMAAPMRRSRQRVPRQTDCYLRPE